ncbi:MaoC/PaaZ C-terminal domain-containing protein [Variovorax sp. J22P168]|uniref:MaoC/PaaZ C-terminal domain-containing protein n=1 Tax=Variovorax jilinensis TaxID=3053513 RepID=UPI00257732AC|nr:MaoC/PaaZ C-terminal domain-containing protein [Variovorax sp. J22P168]MDM0015334.1 MaoC/PaaZ C-terminal domain-containing protein [Variovorax sp. J22P168]
MIDLPKLLDHPIPEARQKLSRRDAALYALSVGLGQDPLDARQLSFVDPARADMPILPFMAVVLAPQGPWMADPALGIDYVRAVHGEQSMRFEAPLPTEGEIVARLRVLDVVDKGADRGALLYTEKELRNAATGERCAVLHSTLFLRGDGGFGGPTRPVAPAHRPPDRAPDHTLDLPTRPEQALYYRLNGDLNPLHADPAAAAKAGYARPILHGLCTLGLCGHALLRTLCDYDAARLAALSLRFSAPVLPGDTVRVELWDDGSFRARALERDTLVINHGKADIRLP